MLLGEGVPANDRDFIYACPDRLHVQHEGFRMFKFRTMVPNAEALTLAYAHLSERPWSDFKITNDPRITKVGKVLRQTSLDKLPRFIDVVLGQMSLVERPWRR